MIGKIECFKIRLLQATDSCDFGDMDGFEPVKTIRCLSPYLCLNPVIILADPFLFVHNDTLFLFYESKRLTSPGVIKMICTQDLEHWSEPLTVLKENFHLSYPYVFADDNGIYMIPETGADGSVRIYQATDNGLTKWELRKKLLVQPGDKEVKMDYADSSVYKKGDVYYLMTTLQYADGVNTLELYCSDSLMGTYKAHPCSPIAHSSKVGRNAGCLQMIDGKLYRYSQDCTVRYGDNVNISEVLELSPLVYEERLLKENIFPLVSPFYKYGGHQLNIVRFRGKTVVATDAKEYHYLLLQRVMNRL